MNLDRLKNTFIWTAANGYKKTIRSTVALFFAFLLVYSVNLGFTASMFLGREWEILQMENAWRLTIIMFYFVLIFGAGSIATDMRTKEGRVMTMMLPASNAEKFWTRILWLMFSLIVSCVVAIICADIMRVIISYIVSWPIHGSMLLTIISNGIPAINTFSNNNFLETTLLCLLFIYTQSIFVLGGTFFRRHPTLFTVISMFLLSLILSFIAAGIFNNLPSLPEFILDMCQRFFENVNYDILLSIINLITIALIVLHYWVAYKLYCRIQIISNKWINL